METHGVKITWLGHAAFRLEWNGIAILIDPFLGGNPKCPESEKHPSRVDAILVTHGHADHTGDVVELAKRTGAKVVGMAELGGWLSRQGVAQEQIVGMNIGGTVEAAGVRVTMVQAFHSCGGEEDGRPVYLGEAAGYIVRFPGGLSLYHAGDTGVFGDMRLIGELYKPGIACLPIGDFYTMGPEQAAHAARLLGAKTVIPMHYGTFPVLTGTPAELKKHLGGACEVFEMTPGKTA